MTLPRPIPPRSVIKLTRLWLHARNQGHKIGEIFRIGYYSQQDGLNCVWMVDHSGDYCMTAEHDWITEHFEIISISDEEDLFGMDRPVLTALSQD